MEKDSVVLHKLPKPGPTSHSSPPPAIPSSNSLSAQSFLTLHPRPKEALPLSPIHKENELSLNARRVSSFIDYRGVLLAHREFKVETLVDAKADWHRLSFEELELKLNTMIDRKDPRESAGLKEIDVQSRLAVCGPNELLPPKEKPEIVKWLLQFLDPFMLLLMVAFAMTLGSYIANTDEPTNLYTAIILIGVIVASCTFSYFQERQSAQAMALFNNMIPLKAHVKRDNHVVEAKANTLVPGDLVYIKIGDQVPADIRMLWVSGLKIDLSSITGENLPQLRTIHSDEEEPLEAKNMAWSTALVLDGEGWGVVVATGGNTQIGAIASLASGTDVEESSLQKELKHVVKIISVLAISMAIIFYIIGVARGLDPWLTFINTFIVVIVANVPQGLPPTVMTALSVTAKKLAGKNVFVKKLKSIETLGAATVIASDKTGTLTMNQMTVSNFWFDGNVIDMATVVRGGTAAPEDPGTDVTEQTLEKIKLIATLCNRAQFKQAREAKRMSSSLLIQVQDKNVDAMKQRKIDGDPSETALLRFVDLLWDVDEQRREWTKLFEVPFNSKWKYSLSIVTPFVPLGKSRPDDQPVYALLKGGPDVLVNMCSHYYTTDGLVPKDGKFKDSFEQAYRLFAGQGERVLGFAWKKLDSKEFSLDDISKFSVDDKNYPESDFGFCGLVSLIDPPKPGVPEAVLTVRGAGVRVIMVTGDHPLTAEAIAKKVGIISENQLRSDIARYTRRKEEDVPESEVGAVVVAGSELKSFNEKDWQRVLAKPEIVFARTTPVQKLEIVDMLQKNGEVVAVTGDGVNDSPALKKASIGVAMGSGSDVAKDAAGVVIMDDNFASIVQGIHEGRIIFDNLTKTIAYTLAHLPAEVVPVLFTLAFGYPTLMSSLLILSVDLGTEMMPAMSLAYEVGESDVMQRPPRGPNSRLVSNNLLRYAYLQLGLIEVLCCLIPTWVAVDYWGIPWDRLTNDSLFIKDPEYEFATSTKVFTKEYQVDLLFQIHSIYFLHLVMSQVWHIWNCRTRIVSLFSHPFSNTVLVYGVFVEILLLLIIVYTPGVHQVFETAWFPPIFWLFTLVPLVLITGYNESVKYFARTYPDGFSAKYLVF